MKTSLRKMLTGSSLLALCLAASGCTSTWSNGSTTSFDPIGDHFKHEVFEDRVSASLNHGLSKKEAYGQAMLDEMMEPKPSFSPQRNDLLGSDDLRRIFRKE